MLNLLIYSAYIIFSAYIILLNFSITGRSSMLCFSQHCRCFASAQWDFWLWVETREKREHKSYSLAFSDLACENMKIEDSTFSNQISCFDAGCSCATAMKNMAGILKYWCFFRLWIYMPDFRDLDLDAFAVEAICNNCTIRAVKYIV